MTLQISYNTILGVDPGLNRTGWGVITAKGNHLRFVASGCITSDAKLSLPKRLAILSDGIKEIAAAYRPDICAIEETFVNTNPLSSLKLGHARGALILALAQEKLDIFEYAATLVKKSITGVGRAEKQQVQAMIKHLLPGSSAETYDAADALAVAICHASHQPLAQKIAKQIA